MTEDNELFNPLTEEQLQELVDAVALAIGEKAKYTINVTGRLRRHSATASTWGYHLTGRRTINFARSELHRPTNPLIVNIIHEIAHFKECERGRRQWNKAKQRVFNPTSKTRALQFYGYHKHKSHTKRFDRIFQKLLNRVQITYGENLRR